MRRYTKQSQKHRNLQRKISWHKKLLYFPILICLALLCCLIIFFALKSHLIHAQDILTAASIDADSKQPLHQSINELHSLVENFSKFPVVSHGDRESKKIALTFDADMTYGMKDMLLSGKVKSYYDERIIDILRQTHTKATLFLSGLWIELYPQATKDLAKDPLFQLANHSYSHPSFEGYCYGLRQVTSSQEEEEEILKTQRLLSSYGIANGYFRFPGGCFGEDDLVAVTNHGLIPVQWDSAGVDGFNYSRENIEKNVLDSAQNGSIIVLHMNGAPNDPQTVYALPYIISTLKERGFTFVTIQELLSSSQ